MGHDGAVPGNPTVCLAMMVRDEVPSLTRGLPSILPLIDSWRVLDTGSTDGTPELLQRMLGHLPGHVQVSPWQDFGTNRTELVQWSRGAADWLLLLDADMTVEAEPTFKEALASHDSDVGLVDVVGSLRYRMPYLVRGDKDLHYVGRTHEYLDGTPAPSRAPFDGLRIHHHGDGSSRPVKFERDLTLLQADLADDPTSPRTLFYLAQTYRDLGRVDEAVDHYRRRLTVGGWEEEGCVAACQLGLLEERRGRDEAAVDAFEHAWDLRPSRAEPLYHLARIARRRRRHSLAWLIASAAVAIPYPHDDLLFVDEWIYRWGAGFELADAAWRTGELDVARRLCAQLLDVADLPPEHRRHVDLIVADTVP